MAGNLRRTKLKGWFEFYREICPVCGKRGGCMINEKGDTVVCIRIESNIVFSRNFPSWVHSLKKKRTMAVSEIEGTHIEGHPKKDEYTLNRVYRSLLNNTILTNNHYEHLRNRGMTDTEIFSRQYRSFPEKPWEVTKLIALELNQPTFEGIPGFFENQYGWTIAGSQGILIPYRNIKNEIIGFQTRVDNIFYDVEINPGSIPGLQARVKEQPNLVQIMVDGEIIKEVELEVKKKFPVYHGNGVGFVTLVKGQRYFWLSSAKKTNGTGQGNPLPIHIAVPTYKLQSWKSGTIKAKSVWITEGALKADIAAEHVCKVFGEKRGDTFIAIPGVNTWRAILPYLKKIEAETVYIAFDMDLLENPQVLYHLKQLSLALKNEGYDAFLVIWNPDDGKGIDDMFTNKKIPSFKKI